MEFDKISNSHSINFRVPKENKTKPSDKDAQNIESNKTKETPVNPNYWQAAKGISFRGNSVEQSEEFKQFRETFLKSCLAELQLDEQVADCFIEKYNKIAQNNDSKTLKTFYDVASALKYINDDTQASKFLDYLDFVFENMDKSNSEMTYFYYGNMCKYFAQNNADDSLVKSLLSDFIQDSEISEQDKTFYLNLCFPLSSSNDTEVNEKLLKSQNGINCLKDFKKSFREPLKDSFISRLDFSADDFSKLVALLKSEKISKEGLETYFNSARYYISDAENSRELVSNLYKEGIENDNASYIQHFNNLINPNLMQVALPFGMMNTLLNNSTDNERQIVQKFADYANRGKSGFFHHNDLKDALDIIDKSNIDELGEFLKTYDGSLSDLEIYTNPVTGKFDKKIADCSSDIVKELKDDNKYFEYNSYNVKKMAKSLVDLNTGEISPIGLKLYKSIILNQDEFHFFGSKKTRNNNGRFFDFDRYISCFGKIIDSARDSKGAVNKTNAMYINDFLTNDKYNLVLFNDDDLGFFNLLKDKNGVIKRKEYKKVRDLLKMRFNLYLINSYISLEDKLGTDKTNLIVESLENIFGDKKYAATNFAQLSKYLVDENGDFVEDNLEFIHEMAPLLKGINLYEEVFDLIKDENIKKFYYSFIDENNPEKSSQNYVFDIVNSVTSTLLRLKQEDVEINPFVCNILKQTVDNNCSLLQFGNLFKKCIINPDEPPSESNFDKITFAATMRILHAMAKSAVYIDVKSAMSLIKGNYEDISKLKFKTKTLLLESMKNLKETLSEEELSQFDFLDDFITKLDNSLIADDIALEIDSTARNTFIADILANPPKYEKLTPFEQVIKDEGHILKTCDEGLPLSYSREEFLSDLNAFCDSEAKIKLLSEKAGIIPATEQKDGKKEITGYEGIITLDNLDLNNEDERALYDILHKFMYENSVQTKSEKLNAELNKIIKAVPEFINCIGKKQHGTHAYTLDIHQLLVLYNSVTNEDYLKLNSTDKAMLKTACIFHDIAKEENTVDKGHQYPSSIYARSIVKKFFPNPELRDRVYEIIKNHHWLEEYNNASDKDEKAQEIAYNFRRPNDFEIAKIMAKADLMSVSDNFYSQHKDALEDEKLKPVEEKLDYFYQTGCALFLDNIINPAKLKKNHTEIFNGREYSVVNFKNIKNTDDLNEYGFAHGKTKDNLFLLVHMVDRHSISQDLKTVKKLTSAVNGGVLSESLITPQYQRTYGNRKYGVLLSQINPNIVNIDKENQGSGTEKDLSNAIGLIFGKDNLFLNSNSRNYFKDNFLKALNLPDDVSDEDYAKFYKEVLSSKNSLSQIPDTKEYPIGSYKISGAKLKEAICEFQNSIIDKTQNKHNEIVGFSPKITAVVAKEDSLEKVPQDLLDFAYENNLPVILL